MYYSNIKTCDIANGEGIRTSLFVSGCSIHCKGCFNKEAWDFHSGSPYTKEVEDKIFESLREYWCDGLSILGGEPMDNQETVWSIIKRFREEFGKTKSIWLWTGYATYKNVYPKDPLLEKQKLIPKTEYTNLILDNIDVLVEGMFVEELRDISLKWCGSSNQIVTDIRLRENGDGDSEQ